MKKTVLNKEWMFNKHGEFCGVDLGSDFCAEHECGIGLVQAAFNIDGITKKKITKLFGLPVRTKIEPNFGIEARMIHTLPEQFVNGIAGKYRFIGFYDTTFAKWVDTLVKDAIRYSTSHKSEFVAYWGDRGFLIVSSDQDKMIALRDAFRSHNIAIFHGNSNFISNKGLVLAIATKLDEEVIKAMNNTDKSVYNLRTVANATGIEDKLKKAGRRFYALSPRWKDETETEVVFWLNPYDQHTYNHGSFTVAELEQWINNEGPIIKNNEENN